MEPAADEDLEQVCVDMRGQISEGHAFGHVAPFDSKYCIFCVSIDTGCRTS